MIFSGSLSVLVMMAAEMMAVAWRMVSGLCFMFEGL